MSARSRGSRRVKVRAPRSKREPLTEAQKRREILLIELGVTKADIARAINEDAKNISGVFLDKFRSLGPDGIEQRIVDYLESLRLQAQSPDRVTRESLGWIDPVSQSDVVRALYEPCSCTDGEGTRNVDRVGNWWICRVCGGGLHKDVRNETPANGVSAAGES